jgi:hypothetical protein
MTLNETIRTEDCPSMLYAHAYKLCGAIRALNSIQKLTFEGGAVERMTGILMEIAEKLGCEINTLWIKYDRYLHDTHFHRVESQIGSGWFDSDVIARIATLNGHTGNS